mmetsp:Transcript_21362/g.59206  ORF Transcript_21362/g.59206 Transcript_21362/m.59206 type:complete len:267 (+) Transcript_21362:42-842(+)
MVNDILCRADPYFFRLSTDSFGGGQCACKSKPKTFLPPSRAMSNGSAYIRLRDSVIEEIANSTSPQLQDARTLAERYLSRDLYKCVFEISIDQRNASDLTLWQMPEDEIKAEMLEFWEGRQGGSNTLAMNDVIVDKFSIHHGRKRQNPIENIRVVPSSQLSQLKRELSELPVAKPVDVSKYQAQTSLRQEQPFIRVYCRDSSKCSQLEAAFRMWTADIYRQNIDVNTTPFLNRLEEKDIGSASSSEFGNDMAQSAIISQLDTPGTA